MENFDELPIEELTDRAGALDEAKKVKLQQGRLPLRDGSSDTRNPHETHPSNAMPLKMRATGTQFAS